MEQPSACEFKRVIFFPAIFIGRYRLEVTVMALGPGNPSGRLGHTGGSIGFLGLSFRITVQ